AVPRDLKADDPGARARARPGRLDAVRGATVAGAATPHEQLKSMYRPWRLFRTVVSSLRLWPHLLVLVAHPHRDAVRMDLQRWCEIIFAEDTDAPRSRIPAFLRLMSFHHEYRNLFYYRTGLPGRLLSPLCRPLPTLHITTPEIGPG